MFGLAYRIALTRTHYKASGPAEICRHIGGYVYGVPVIVKEWEMAAKLNHEFSIYPCVFSAFVWCPDWVPTTLQGA